MEIKKLWEGIKVKNCDTCTTQECNGRLNYESLCANVNYLKEYGEQNYEKNSESFVELKKIIGDQKPSIFSFGAGIGLEYVGAMENFGSQVVYYPIEECRWAIADTVDYKNFEPKLPKRFLKFEEGMFMLAITQNNPVLCFFNSLFTIARNTPSLKNKLVSTLLAKQGFYFVCNYTVNNNYHMPSEEQDFIAELLKKLKGTFNFKKFDILGGRGIIVQAQKK